MAQNSEQEGAIQIIPASEGEHCSYCFNLAVEHIIVTGLDKNEYHYSACPNHIHVWRYQDGSY